MDRRIWPLDSTRKKVLTALLCGALVAATWAGTVLAANARSSLLAKMGQDGVTYSTDDGKTWSKDAPSGVTVNQDGGKTTITSGNLPAGGEGKGMLSKVENGVATYSTDGGKTWSKDAPDGVTVNQDGGKIEITNSNPPASGR